MRYKLVCFDMDGVIFKHVNFWLELHKALGTYERGYEMTLRYLKTDYAKLVEEVVGRLWKGKRAERYYELVQKVQYNPGAEETFAKLKQQGLQTMIISSGPYDLALRAQKELGVNDSFTNRLIIRDNIITGEFRWPIGYGNKAKLLRDYCQEHKIELSEVITVGDEENDIEKAEISGLSIAFNSKSESLKKACDVVINSNDLRGILRYIK